MGDGILRVFRPSGLHARVERAKRTWDELSRAEKVAIGGLGLGGLGAVVGAGMMLGSTGDDTHELVDRYARAGDDEKIKIEKTCVSRVHDLRDMLLDPKREKTAKKILRTVQDRLQEQSPKNSSQEAMLRFIQEALDYNGNSFGMDSLEEIEISEFEQHVRKAQAEAARRWKFKRISSDVALSKIVGTHPENWEEHEVYGHVATWDVRDVIDMREAFSNLSVAEPLDLRFWDTRNVRSMRRTFSMFTGLVDVETWDTRSVIDMSQMFSGASRFNADLTMWKTGLVEDMSDMFSGARNFNCDIGKWDTSKVTTMRSMFNDAASFNSALSEWDVRNVKTMRKMFQNAKSLESPDLGRWKTGSVVDMSHMFSGASKFNGNIESWDTREVTDMSHMFAGAEKFNRPLRWDTRKVTDMSRMFSGASRFNADLGMWETGRVENMSHMFAGAVKFNRPLRWDTSKAKSMRAMFFFASNFDQDIGGWDTSSVTDMSNMFQKASAFNRKLNWDTSSVERREEMFSEAPRMEEENKPGFSGASGFGRETRQGSRAYL